MRSMTERLFFDTNVLVYALDPADPEKRQRAADLIRRAVQTARIVVSPQTLNECYRVLTARRNLIPYAKARIFIHELIPFCHAPVDAQTTQMAFHLEDKVRASWWDCVMLASALQAGCRGFLSEDMQDGQEIEGMTILNPFTATVSTVMG